MGATCQRDMPSQHTPDQHQVHYDTSRNVFLHACLNTPQKASQFQGEVNDDFNHKQNQSDNVATVHQIKDKHITSHFEKEISIAGDCPNQQPEKVLTILKNSQLHQFNPRIITKRTYIGVQPTFQQKIKIIKEDIQNLRAVVDSNEIPSDPFTNIQVKLISPRGVEKIFSYEKDATGNLSLLEVNEFIKESVIIGKEEDRTIIRLVLPASESNKKIQGHCNEGLRKSQITNNDPLFLSRAQTDKSINSTSRSMNGSHVSNYQNINSESKASFVENGKKLAEGVYFTSQ